MTLFAISTFVSTLTGLLPFSFFSFILLLIQNENAGATSARAATYLVFFFETEGSVNARYRTQSLLTSFFAASSSCRSLLLLLLWQKGEAK